MLFRHDKLEINAYILCKSDSAFQLHMSTFKMAWKMNGEENTDLKHAVKSSTLLQRRNKQPSLKLF